MKNKRPYRSVTDFFEGVGGTAKLAAALGVHQYTVDRWRKFGIPIKYWKAIAAKIPITPTELYEITDRTIQKLKK